MDIKQVLESPDAMEPSIKGRINAHKLIGGRILRVTYRDEDVHIIIVTVAARRHGLT